MLGENSLSVLDQFVHNALHNMPISLSDLQSEIESRLWSEVPFSVPRTFFDGFVTGETPMGHVAAYPNFDDIHDSILAQGLVPLGRISYRGPWLFNTKDSAGWFFREKFSVGTTSNLGEDILGDVDMFEILQRMLGVRTTSHGVAVNWGVTYAAYVCPSMKV